MTLHGGRGDGIGGIGGIHAMQCVYAGRAESIHCDTQGGVGAPHLNVMPTAAELVGKVYRPLM